MGTDKDWEKWGATDPYFGVLSCEPYRNANISETSREAFFRSGDEHVRRVLRLISETLDYKSDPTSTLDFGCGVGRLAIPFARRSIRCVGVDVSRSMLAEASKNSAIAGIHNIDFIKSNGDLTEIAAKFSLVHSFIVLQHIPWSRGRSIVVQLADMVEQDGALAIHYLTSSKSSRLVQALVRARYAAPPLNWLRNVIRRRPIFEPAMQLHIYDTDVILHELKRLGFDEMALRAEADVGEFTSVYLLARRRKLSSPIS